MRVATFNLQNLFTRARALNLDSWDDGRVVLEDVSRLMERITKPRYSDADKRAMVAILTRHGFSSSFPNGRPFEVNEIRGRLFRPNPSTGEIRIVAEGRSSWDGGVDFTRDQIRSDATEATARVIAKVNADVMCVVEVEGRIALQRFNDEVLSRYMERYEHCMSIDGNDARGIDVGVLSRHPIRSVVSHVDDGYPKRIFSRDCLELDLDLKGHADLWMLVSHFKSKGHGSATDNDRKRRRQAARMKSFYEAARKRCDRVIVAADFNDTPDSKPLEPLVGKTDLRDVMSHRRYKGPPGTFKETQEQLDYLMLSPPCGSAFAGSGQNAAV